MDIITKLSILCGVVYLASSVVQPVTDIFNSMDLNKNGGLSLDELYTAFDTIDVNGDQTVEMEEFVAAGLGSKALFNFIDGINQTEEDGKINRSVVPFLHRELDLDGNGEISLDEFIENNTF